MIKIAHISDIHIRNFKYHEEYRTIFKQLYQKLEQVHPDIIINTGDTVHSKNQLSPEVIELASNLFTRLANIAPLYIIAGNHDLLIKNPNRLDAISPIVKALDNPKITYLKYSDYYPINSNIALGVFSLCDEEDKWPVKPKNNELINIALHHGPLYECTTESNWQYTAGNAHRAEIFFDYDYVMLGDIHRRQSLTTDDKICYAGSLVQGGFGEQLEKGFLLWSISDKENHKVDFVQLDNPKPFVTINLDRGNVIPVSNIPPNARIRIIPYSKVTKTDIINISQEIKYLYNPESVIINNAIKNIKFIDENDNIINYNIREDINDLNIQNKLIKESLSEYKLDNTKLESIFELNKKYDELFRTTEFTTKGIRWSLKSLEWSNLFNYGSNNRIDFQNLNGLVGILGENFSGKSSIIEVILYGIFNTTSKNYRKKYHIINQNETRASVKLEIEIGNSIIIIYRELEKISKTLKGETFEDAKGTLSIEKFNKITLEKEEIEEMCDSSKWGMESYLRNLFGNIEDFLTTSLSSQKESEKFINEGSSKRKEIVARFLNLLQFEKKYKLAVEDYKEIKTLLKKTLDDNIDNKISSLEEDLKTNYDILEEKKASKIKYEQFISDIVPSIVAIKQKISEIPSEITSIEKESQQLELKIIENKQILTKIEEYKTNIVILQAKLLKMNDFIATFNISEFKDKASYYETLIKESVNIETAQRDLQKHLKQLQKDINLLYDVPCGEQFPSCRFIANAFAAKYEVCSCKEHIETIKCDKKSINDKIESLNIEKVKEYIKKYDELLKNKMLHEKNLSETTLKLERDLLKLSNLQKDIESLKESIHKNEQNKQLIQKHQEYKEKLQNYEKQLKEKKDILNMTDNHILEYTKTIGSIEQNIENLNNTKNKIEKLKNQNEIYELYLKCISSTGNGIPYNIIKQQLPLINNEISKVLSQFVDFEIFMEAENDDLDIYIKHPKYAPRLIESTSGAEGAIANMAVRIALTTITSLPITDIFILDEPGVQMDNKRLDGFITTLDILKSYFKSIIIISHLETLKECIEEELIITKDIKGYAHMEV